MNKLIITVLGRDKPGIIAAVSKSLYKLGCNLENVNQMILQNEFAGFFLVEPPSGLRIDSLKETLKNDLAGKGLHIHVNDVASNGNNGEDADAEIFLITTIGPDQKGLVARFTEIIADYNVNVINLTAVFKGGDNPEANIMTYEVAITSDVDHTGLFNALRNKARGLNLDITIQHRNIFQAINKI